LPVRSMPKKWKQKLKQFHSSSHSKTKTESKKYFSFLRNRSSIKIKMLFRFQLKTLHTVRQIWYRFLLHTHLLSNGERCLKVCLHKRMSDATVASNTSQKIGLILSFVASNTENRIRHWKSLFV
jgi:hypothetical protein